MNIFRNIPSIDDLMAESRVQDLLTLYNRDFIIAMLRETVKETREGLKNNDELISKEILTQNILDLLYSKIQLRVKGSLQKVINATGVVLHTNMGRAILGKKALHYLNQMAEHYNNLELDLAKGTRGSRYTHVEELLLELTGAEAALVVNNNAAAVLLALKTMADNKEVIVSRGQLIEIGGAFRIPEVMKQSGAILVEVGTTNKTNGFDYENAINENTALLFSAHTSNYKIEGFTEEVSLEQMVSIGKKQKIATLLDLGSGILCDMGKWGLSAEPTVKESVAGGADVITFSGDKLLGGPQAGIIVGKKEYIEKMKKNQLTRALRVDKLTIAALEGTLLEYQNGNSIKNIPVLRMLRKTPEELNSEAEELKNLLDKELSSSDKIDSINIVPVEDMVGGGAYPTYKLAGYGVEIAFINDTLENISKKLRLMDPAILTRKQDDKMLISVRALLDGDNVLIASLLKLALN